MPPATPRLLRRINAAGVLDALRDGRAAARDGADGAHRALAAHRRRGGRRAAAARLGGGGGRRAGGPRAAGAQPRLRADAGYVAGVDIGEVKVRAAVADLRGDVWPSETMSTFADAERLPVIRRVPVRAKDAARARCWRPAWAARARWTPRRGACCSAACSRTASTSRGAMPGRVRRAPGGGERLQPGRARRALAAAPRGGLDDVVCVLAGERIGAGIMVGGRLMRGHAGAAGELAFLGAFEHEHGARGDRPARAQAGRRGAGGRVRSRAGAGDEDALAIVERAERWAGQGIVTTAQIVNPELVVIGGGVARAGEVLLAPLRAAPGGDGAAAAAPGRVAAGRARAAARRAAAGARRARAAAARRARRSGLARGWDLARAAGDQRRRDDDVARRAGPRRRGGRTAARRRAGRAPRGPGRSRSPAARARRPA